MRKNIFLFFLLISTSLSFAQIESGVKIGIGMGWLEKQIRLPGIAMNFNGSLGNGLKPNLNTDIGYQFRIHQTDKLLFDTGLNYRIRFTRTTHVLEGKSLYNKIFTESSSDVHGISIHAIQNLKVYKGVGIGVGIEPTLYIKTGHISGNNRQNVFDIPIVTKIGYNFKKFEVAATYKHGFASLYKNEFVKKGKSREVGISLYVPLFK